MVVVETQ